MAAKQAPSTIRPERLAAYDRLIETVPGVERKGASMPYTSVNGNMFSYLFGEGSLALRLAEADREIFLDLFGTRLHEAHGTVQKEYVDVPDALLDEVAQLAKWFGVSHSYASGLKPKPTTRRQSRGD